MAASDKDAHEWAWEFHKQCDSLLHSRLAAYFTGQSFLVTAFIVVVANIQKFHNLVPAAIAITGLLTAVLWLFVNAAMYSRLEAINQKYLFSKGHDDLQGKFRPIDDGTASVMREVFTFYISNSIAKKIIWLFPLPIPIPLHIYKVFIPYTTPVLFITLWLFLAVIQYWK